MKTLKNGTNNILTDLNEGGKMTVEADRTIGFRCEKCGEYQYHEYSLEVEQLKDRVVMSDRIDCEYCGHTNHVIEYL